MFKPYLLAGMLAVFATGAVLATGAWADETPAQHDPYENPLSQCIRDNAAKVEASIADINQAVDFLVGKVCGVQVVEHNIDRGHEIQQRALSRLQTLCDEQTAAKVDLKPENGKAPPDYCGMVKAATATVAAQIPYDAWSSATAVTNPTAAEALAAQLLMDLRTAHKRRGN